MMKKIFILNILICTFFNLQSQTDLKLKNDCIEVLKKYIYAKDFDSKLSYCLLAEDYLKPFEEAYPFEYFEFDSLRDKTRQNIISKAEIANLEQLDGATNYYKLSFQSNYFYINKLTGIIGQDRVKSSYFFVQSNGKIYIDWTSIIIGDINKPYNPPKKSIKYILGVNNNIGNIYPSMVRVRLYPYSLNNGETLSGYQAIEIEDKSGSLTVYLDKNSSKYNEIYETLLDNSYHYMVCTVMPFKIKNTAYNSFSVIDGYAIQSILTFDNLLIRYLPDGNAFKFSVDNLDIKQKITEFTNLINLINFRRNQVGKFANFETNSKVDSSGIFSLDIQLSDWANDDIQRVKLTDYISADPALNNYTSIYAYVDKKSVGGKKLIEELNDRANHNIMCKLKMLHYNEGKNDLFCFIDGYSGLNKLDTFNSQKTTLTSTLGLIYTSKSNEIKLLLESRDRVAKIIANPPLNLKTLNSIKTEYYNKQITIFGYLLLRDYYNWGYQNYRESHYSFVLYDGNDDTKVVVYIKKEIALTLFDFLKNNEYIPIKLNGIAYSDKQEYSPQIMIEGLSFEILK